MANGELIIGIVEKIGIGNSAAVPPPIYAEVYYVLGIPVPTKPREGRLQLTVDPSLNKNQMEASLRAQVATAVSAITGVAYATNDVEGCTF
jgi:hypothetical protein